MKKYLITGLIVILPTILTLEIANLLLHLFTKPFLSIVTWTLQQFSISLPPEATLILSQMIALVLLFIVIILLGMITHHFLFKSLANTGNYILLKIPFVKTVYKISRDIFTSLFSLEGKQTFKEVVTVPFPNQPHLAVGMSCGEVPKECEEKVGETLTAVFVPTVPHPVSGFLFLVPTRDIQSLDITKEDALKFILSCGVVHPGPKV